MTKGMIRENSKNLRLKREVKDTMNLEKLIGERNDLLGQIKAYEGLQLGLEQIERYNRENYTNDELKVYTMAYQPHLEEITLSNIAEKIEHLTSKLLTVSKEINEIKMNAK